MAVRKVIRMGHPTLRKVAEPVAEKEINTPEFQTLIDDMIETMDAYNGRGLAAPQVDVGLRVLVMIWDFDPDEDPYLQVLINPKLTYLTQEESTFWEGCLSVPGLIGKVARPNRLKVDALDEDGEEVSFIAEGFAATVVQHECDHLDGKLYVDRITNTEDFAYVEEYQQFMVATGEKPVEPEGSEPE